MAALYADTYDPCSTGDHSQLTFRVVQLPGKVTVVAAGYAHCVVGLDGGRAFSWGFGEEGQLGLGREENQHVPREVGRTSRGSQCFNSTHHRFLRQIAGLAGLHMIAASLGRGHSVCVVSKRMRPLLYDIQHHEKVRCVGWTACSCP